jgi:hypothetical protein
MNLELILFIIIILLVVMLLTNFIKFKKIKIFFLEEIDRYEEKLIEEESKRQDADARMDSYKHLKEDPHEEDFYNEDNTSKINNNKDLYTSITKLVRKENKDLLNKINDNILFIAKGDNLFGSEVGNESKILLSLSSLNINYQNFYLGKSNTKLRDLLTLVTHHKKDFFIINNDLEKASKEGDIKKIKKLLSLWSNKKYTQLIVKILTKKNFMNKTDLPKIIAVMSDSGLEKLHKISPKISEEFTKKGIYIQNISNLAQFIEKSN